MFSPKNSQDVIKQNNDAISDVSSKHESFSKRAEVRIQKLENENAIRKGEVLALIDSHKEMSKEIDLIKEALIVLQKWMVSSGTRFDLLEKNLSNAVNAKLDLVTEIKKAKMRLDEIK